MLAAAAPRLAVRRTFSVVHRRSIITVKKPLVSGEDMLSGSLTNRVDGQYVSNATAIGEGRNGTVKSDGDVPLSLKLSTPKSIGGKGDGQNPEQLFAMGYACKSPFPICLVPEGDYTCADRVYQRVSWVPFSMWPAKLVRRKLPPRPRFILPSFWALLSRWRASR